MTGPRCSTAAILISALFLGCATPPLAVGQFGATHDPSAGDHPFPATTSAPSVAGDQASARTLAADDLKGIAWRSVGPANMCGRVADIALVPGSSTKFLVGFGTGGVFRTSNHGTTFEPVFEHEAVASIGSIAVTDAPPNWSGWAEQEEDEDDPSSRAERGKGMIVWVGTGEGNGRNSSSWGNGVYRSTDGGSTFKHVGLEDAHDIPRIAVDPRDPDVCYVAALGHLWGPNEQRGVYKTADGGKTWTALLQIDENTGACDVIVDPSHPDTVYAAMYTRRRTAYSFQSGGPDGGIFRSDDGGSTWKKLANGLPQQSGRIGLDIYRGDPRILYAVIESDDGGKVASAWNDRSRSGGLFRTDDRGETWHRLNDRNMRSFYFSKVRIDPQDDQRVYMLGWYVAISDDGGKTFRNRASDNVHVDCHAMVIDPADPEHLLLGTDGGIYASHDRGKTWDFYNNLAVGQFYNIAVDMSDPYRIGGGLQDNGSWIGPSATLEETSEREAKERAGITNQHWRFVNNGDGFHVAFDPTDPNVMYAESQGGELVRIGLDTMVRRRLIPAPKEGQPRFRFNWNSPFFISPHDPTVLYLGGNHVFRLTERGDKWEMISDDLSTGDVSKITTVGSDAETHCTVVSLAESELQKGLIWAGTDDGLIHVTTDGGGTWNNVTPPEVDGWYVSRIEPSHHDAAVAYASVDGHRSDRMDPLVLRTDDTGQSWTDVTGDLPAGGPVKVIREDRGNANVLYAGTEFGAFVTVDGGSHWVQLNGKSLPTVAVDDLVQHPRERDLVVGTHGRSIWVLDDASFLSQLTPEAMSRRLALFGIRPARPRLFLPLEGYWGQRFFRAKNPPKGAIINYWLREYDGEKVEITISDAHDNKVRSLSGTNRPGMNRVTWDLQPDEKQRFDDADAWLRQTRFVPAGEYTVTVKSGDHKAKQTVTVLPAPNAPGDLSVSP